MRKILSLLCLIFILNATSIVESPFKIPPITHVKKKLVNSGLHTFLMRMARIESNNDSHAKNKYGMLGKYQFHPTTLREIGIKTTETNFLNNEQLQDSAMVRYMKENAKELRQVIQRWSGQTINGIKITKSGILAGAHFSGTMGILSFFYPEKYQYRTSDVNGATVALYMEKFQNLQLDF